MTFGLFEILLLIAIVVLFGGAILRIGGKILYILLVVVGIVFLLRILGVLV